MDNGNIDRLESQGDSPGRLRERALQPLRGKIREQEAIARGRSP